MKKLLIILFAILTIFALSSCDELELSAPAGDTTAEETTKKSDETANVGEAHTNCDYCGQLEGNNRWFIAEVAADLMIHPVGSGCFEARSAMDAGIDLWYKEVDGDPDKKLKAGDIVKITYNGLIMESYPVQISADEVSVIDEIVLPTPEPSIDDYIKNNGSSTYLVLPSSKEEVSVYGTAAGYLDRIDLELLATAESQLSSFECVYLTLDDENYLCLGCETIVDINPPNAIDGMTSGCNIDHKHVMEEYRISKEPCY